MKLTRYEKILEAFSFSGLLFALVSLTAFWNSLPDYFPVHFDWRGRADGWGGRNTLLLFPFVCALLYFGLGAIRFFRRSERYLPLLAWIKAEMLWIYAIIQWQIIEVATAKRTGLSPSWLLGMFVVLLVTVIWGLMRGRASRASHVSGISHTSGPGHEPH